MTSKITLTNVRIFIDKKITPPTIVLFEGGIVTSVDLEFNTEGAVLIDGKNMKLLPGLIDAHVHFPSDSNLHQLAQYSVTTALDMAAWPASIAEYLRAVAERGGVAYFKTAGLPVCAPGILHARMPGMAVGALVTNVEHARSSRLDLRREWVTSMRLLICRVRTGGFGRSGHRSAQTQ